MLVLSRKANESIEIRPVDERDETPLRELFASGGICIRLVRIGKTRVRVAIDAPPALRIDRGHDDGQARRAHLCEPED